tara:strand:- start:227 stop:1126 length:900 start_codon:yes stop_codon:yes gene_type:complete
MKVAICFSGFPIFVRQHEKFWLDLIDKYEADVYASLWDERHSSFYKNIKKYPVQKEDTVEYFESIYKPTSIEVEDPKVFGETFRFLGEEYDENPKPHVEYSPDQSKLDYEYFSSGQMYSMLYKTWRANMLCNASSKEYDVVVKAETCSSYANMKIVNQNSISMPSYFCCYSWSNWKSNPSYVQSGLWFHLAFGPPHLMYYFSSLIFYLRKYFDECLFFPAESVYNYHLSRRPNINMRFFSSEIKRKGKVLSEFRGFHESCTPSEGLAKHFKDPALEASIKKLDLSEDCIHKMHSKLLFK